MSGPFVLLMRTWSDGEAELIRQLLATAGIPCQVVSDVPHAVLPLTVDRLGEVRVLVPESEADEATDLVAAHLRRGLRLVGREDDTPPWVEAPVDEDGWREGEEPA